MDAKRRTTVLTLLTGALAALALVAARRGMPGASKLAARLAKPALPQGRVEMYGYREVKLS